MSSTALFRFTVPFFCFMWSVLNLAIEFLSSCTVFFSSVISVQYLYFLFVEIFTLFIHFSFEFGEHLYDCYFEPFSGNSLISILLRSFFVVLSLELILLFSLILCVSFYALHKTVTSPNLEVA